MKGGNKPERLPFKHPSQALTRAASDDLAESAARLISWPGSTRGDRGARVSMLRLAAHGPEDAAAIEALIGGRRPLLN
jgi:hypothetical protein